MPRFRTWLCAQPSTRFTPDLPGYEPRVWLVDIFVVILALWEPEYFLSPVFARLAFSFCTRAICQILRQTRHKVICRFWLGSDFRSAEIQRTGPTSDI